MKPFTIILRDLNTGFTSWHHATGEDQAAANESLDVGHVELVGTFDGHITPLWWEE